MAPPRFVVDHNHDSDSPEALAYWRCGERFYPQGLDDLTDTEAYQVLLFIVTHGEDT